MTQEIDEKAVERADSSVRALFSFLVKQQREIFDRDPSIEVMEEAREKMGRLWSLDLEPTCFVDDEDETDVSEENQPTHFFSQVFTHLTTKLSDAFSNRYEENLMVS